MKHALRRIGGHPRIEPATALLLRARTVRGSLRFVANELGRRGRRTYELRRVDARVVVRHGTSDAVTLGEVFHEWHYEPPPALAPAPAAILDLGANVGMFGAFVTARWPLARISAWEPDPDNAAVCEACIAANHAAERWTLRRAAASNAAGSLRFSASADALSHADDAGELTVAADDVLPQMAGADLVKMDIEGGEWAILGDPRFATDPPRALVLEYHPHLCPQPDPRRAVEARLDAAGLTQRHHIFHRADGHGMLWAWRP